MDTSSENGARWSIMEGTVNVPDEKDLRQMSLCRGVTIRKSLFNYTRNNITVSERLGFSYDLKPDIHGPEAYKGTVAVRFEFSASTEVANKILGQLSNEKNPISNKFSDSLIAFKRDSSLATQDWFLTLTYKEEDLRKRGTVYCNKSDVVLTVMDDGRRAAPHPVDHWTQTWQDVSSKQGLGLNIVNVDNDGVYGDRYLNYNGTVFKIPAVTCTQRESGIYLYKNLTSVDKISRNPTDTISFFTHEECADPNSDSPLELFRTGSEAVSYGDINKRLEFKQKEVEREHKQLLMTLEKEREELKSERIKEEAHIAKLKKELEEEKIAVEHQKRIEEETLRVNKEKVKLRNEELEKEKRELEHRLSMESLRRKDYYEDRSYTRKDNSDLLKYLPTLITAGMALFAAFGRK